MFSQNPGQATIADNILLDGRLALFHQRQRWLAVADLHFGYEISQRAAGRLMPMWGMSTIEQRLMQLLAEYQPRHLILLGDLVHNRASAPELAQLVRRIGELTEPVLLAGNHDLKLSDTIPTLDSWQSDGFHFHHGHCEAEVTDRIQIIGHHHPAGNITDGAGLRLKLPAFVQQKSCWIMPAFSPWAGGTAWHSDEPSRIWLCTPARVLRLPEAEVAAS